MTFSYEDFEVGAVAQLSGHTFLKEEIIEFAGRYDPQPFHLSEAGGEATSMGSPGLDNIRWLKPVRVNDTVRLTVRVLSKRVSESKPDRGIVATRWEAYNQHDELVLTVDSAAIFGLRHQGNSQ